MQPTAHDRISRPPAKVTGRTVLYCMIAFFAVITGVNAIMIVAAVSTFGGVETNGAYQAGVAFSRETAAVRAQDKLNWQVTAAVRRSDTGTVLVEVAAQDSTGRPVAGIEARAMLLHPTDKRADHVVPVMQSEPGIFRGSTVALVGQWDLVVELARDGARVFRSRNRVVLP